MFAGVVLQAYPDRLSRLIWTPVPTGFSGEPVFAGNWPDQPTPSYALKRWPSHVSSAHVAEIHHWMLSARASDLVPELIATRDRTTHALIHSRIWDLQSWLPGIADYRKNPSRERLQSACEAVARLHGFWSREARWSPSLPAIDRRLQILSHFRSLRMTPTWLEPFAAQIANWVNRAESLLHPLQSACQIQPCLCDLHHDHLLFEGQRLTGIVDYSAMKWDHPAVDLARMLGDLADEDDAVMADGLAAYHQAGGQGSVTLPLVQQLDLTGNVAAIVNWLIRFRTDRTLPELPRVQERVNRLCRRVASQFAHEN